MNNTLQICNGNSSAGSLRVAGYNFILMFTHGFDGPVQDFQRYEEYEKRSASFIEMLMKNAWGFCGDFAHMFFITDRNKESCLYSETEFQIPISGEKVINILREQNEIHFWLTNNFSEHILLTLIIKLFDLYEIDMHKLRIKWMPTAQDRDGNEFMVRSLGWIAPEQMKKIQNSEPLTHQQVEYFRKVWFAITYSTPDKWIELAHYPNQFNLIEGMKEYLDRLPDSRTGLNYCQRMLLKACLLSRKSKKAARVIGEVIGFERYDTLSDVYIDWWLKSLSAGTAKMPACIVETPNEKEDQSVIGNQYVSLTDYGRALLDGKANWLTDNEVDYYVGGLHVSSLEHKYHFYDEILKKF